MLLFTELTKLCLQVGKNQRQRRVFIYFLSCTSHLWEYLRIEMHISAYTKSLKWCQKALKSFKAEVWMSVGADRKSPPLFRTCRVSTSGHKIWIDLQGQLRKTASRNRFCFSELHDLKAKRVKILIHSNFARCYASDYYSLPGPRFSHVLPCSTRHSFTISPVWKGVCWE